MKRLAVLAAVLVAALGSACTDQSPLGVQPVDPKPFLDIVDGHNDPARSQFFFLPPIRPLRLQPPSSGFNAGLRPVVEIYECTIRPDGNGCGGMGALVSTLRMDDPSAIDRLYVLPSLQQYAAIWRAYRVPNLNAAKFYRIHVKVGSTVLGYADVDIVRTLRQLLQVDREDFVPAFEDFVLPITFWIGNNALCTGTCSSETITLADGGTVELAAEGEVFKFDIEEGTTATSGGNPVTQVTFTLEVCDGVDVDLPKFSECVRLTTLFNAAGGASSALVLSNPALVSMCSFSVAPEESQEELVTLHQQDGDLIRALPHATPNCLAPEPRAPGLGTRSWQWMRDFAGKVFAPRPLYARSRVALLDLGGGGQTHRLGADCTSSPTGVPGMALAVCVPAEAPALQLAPPFPTNGSTITDFQFALPAKMEYVDPDDASRSAAAGTSLPTAVKVTDWHDVAVQGATVTFTEPGEPGVVIGTATSDEFGIAEISWSIASGLNTVIASGRGIAARNNYPEGPVKPFMPDIFSESPQSPVIVGDGAVPFTVTGGEADLIIETLTHSPASPTTADLVEFSVTVKNQGTAATGPFYVIVNTTKDGAPLETTTLVELATEGSSLAPGESRTLCCWRSTRAAGEYSQTAIADFHTDPELNNQVPESNEENNTLTDRYSVAVALTLPIACRGDAGGDLISRGFYVPGYPGTSINQATLHFAAGTAGDYTFSLTARSGTYDGPLLGTATASVTLTADIQANVATTFGFEGLAVTPGTTVTFAIAQVAGPGGSAVYSVAALGDPTCPVIQTNGTTPPLDTFRRQGVQVTIEGSLP